MSSSRTAPAKRILVATDFSDEAQGAVRVAIEYARHLGAHLDMLHVDSTGEVDITRLLADTAAPARPDVPLTLASAGGDPARQILRYAAVHPIDLIVVGTHGRTGVSRLLLGSVAERVLRGARCPVLAVPARPESPVAVEDAAEVATTARPCLVCAKPSADLVCEPCRARIRGEALDRKHREERAGRA
jgi:universal stress protein A